MAPPIYFFSKATRADLVCGDKLKQDFLVDKGLARTFDDVTSARMDCMLTELPNGGPSGSTGVLLMALPVSGDAPMHSGYFPKHQTWKAVLGDDVWVGVDNDHPVTPGDIVRKKTRSGYLCEIKGQKWQVPVIRGPGGSTGLDCEWAWDEQGVVRETVSDTYRDMWESFVSVQDLLFDPEAVTFEMPMQDCGDRCIDALTINYRFGPVEQNLLKLIDSETWTTILMAAVDYPTYRASLDFHEQKKTSVDGAEDSQSTLPGSEDSCQTTDPVGVS